MKPAFPMTSQSSQLDLILTGGSVVGLGDGALLDRVALGESPNAGAALDALLRRHGALVARVCRGILGDAQLAEDATQAVFLVLIRRAGSIRDPDRLAPWLHGVALRTARAARRQHRRSLTSPIPLDETTMIDPTPDPAQSLIRREQAEILHNAINRLPRRYLDPIVLCDLSGLTHAEAAAHLDCPPSTVGVRLKRAREKLRVKLSCHRLDFETALPPVVGLSSIPRTLAASPAAHFLANRVAWTLAAAKWQALAIVLILAGIGTVGVRAAVQTPAPAVPPVNDSPPRPDPPEAKVAPALADVPPWLKIGLPTVREVRDFEQFPGIVAPSRSLIVRPQVGQVVTSVEVAVGDLVQKGQVLFKTDLPELRNERESIKARLTVALLQAKKIGQNTPHSGDPSEVAAKQKATLARLDLANIEEETVVKAPLSGIVAQLDVKADEIVDPGKLMLAEIIVSDPIQVDFNVEERTYVKIQRWLKSKPGTTHLPVHVALVEETEFNHPGQVLFRAVRFDRVDNRANCTLHADLPNLDGTMIPGLSAQVQVEYGEPRQAILITRDTFWNMTRDRSVGSVWVVDANRIVHLREIRLGKIRGEECEVMAGLDPETLIILNGRSMTFQNSGIGDGQPLPPPDTPQPEVPTGGGFQ